jgi:hypothetical protein
MFEDLKTALGKAETKGDIAIVLGFGTAGFAVDALANVHGVFSPGTVSALSATGALSIKKGWDARREAKRAEAAATKVLGEAKEATARAKKLEEFFVAQGYAEGARVIRAQLDWREQDIIDDEHLDQAVEAARNDFLAWVRKPRDPVPSVPDVPVNPAA